MIDFPANPTVGQTFTAAGVTWTWDGTKWTASGLGVAYLPLAGGTMLGPIVLAADPAVALQPATKQYVDGARYGDNRIINGDCRIDQRNNGNSGAATAVYTIDRWLYQANQASKGTWQRVSSAVPGFPYCLNFVSSSAYAAAAADYFFFAQSIEADFVSDFAWGTANAQPVTLSFWASSNQAGTFSGAVKNYAGTRTYPFSYSLAASTWTKVVINIPGDTGGTWVMSGNAGSLSVMFDLGSGSNSRGPANAWASANYNGVTGSVSIVGVNAANFAVTGVKLEIGSVATPFNRQSLAKSLADCQRYYQVGIVQLTCYQNATSGFNYFPILPTVMRAAPTIAYSGTGYINASGIIAGGVNTFGFVASAAATTTGVVQFSANFTANAEL